MKNVKIRLLNIKEIYMFFFEFLNERSLEKKNCKRIQKFSNEKNMHLDQLILC